MFDMKAGQDRTHVSRQYASGRLLRLRIFQQSPTTLPPERCPRRIPSEGKRWYLVVFNGELFCFGKSFIDAVRSDTVLACRCATRTTHRGSFFPMGKNGAIEQQKIEKWEDSKIASEDEMSEGMFRLSDEAGKFRYRFSGFFLSSNLKFSRF